MKKLTLFIWCLWLLACTSPPVEAQTVYVTKTGKKYHDEYCQYLRTSKIELTLSKALELGYDACSVCSPVTEVEDDAAAGGEATPASEKSDESNTPAPSSKPARTAPAKKATASSQCSSLTKTGTRCKRAASANGRCWQHQ